MGTIFQELLDGEAASTLPRMADKMVAEDVARMDLSIMQVKALLGACLPPLLGRSCEGHHTAALLP
jgi:hypothetical protein